MEIASELKSWEKTLDLLEAKDQPITKHHLDDAAKIFEHLPPEVAPRLRKLYDNCSLRSESILRDLFEKIDLSDKKLLNHLLNLFVAYGNFKMSQIIYSLDSNDRWDITFIKNKWYDLGPLLPQPGDIGWKHILVHGLVIEERKLFQTCLRLLTQKLHFHAIALFSNNFIDSSSIIKKNGERVAEKLTEKIRDFANDDEEMIGINSYLFNLLLPFTTDEQQEAIIEATVLDRFKLFMTQGSEFESSREFTRIRSLISDCIMDKSHLQNALIIKLLEHLKCNIIRRKRRHSVEANDDMTVTLESIISGILSGTELTDLVDRIEEVDISPKMLQTSYLSEWVDFLNETLTGKILTFQSSNTLVATCFVLFLTTSSIIDSDLIVKILSLMTKALDNAGQRKLERHFKTFGSSFLLKFSKSLQQRTELLGVLIFIMRIAIYRKEKDITDEFGDLIPKLYEPVCSRFKEIVEKVKVGSTIPSVPLDAHLARLVSLYVEHKTMIEPYLSYNLLSEMCNYLIFPKSKHEVPNNGCSLKEEKKSTYNEIKAKLEALDEKSDRSQQIYQNIINQQYNVVVEQSIGQIGDIKKERSCFRKYFNHLKSISRVSSILLNDCDPQTYKLILDNIVSELDTSDALDHPKVIYLLLMLESLVPKHSKESPNYLEFQSKIAQISFSLIRISKSVELGPSVHLFTRPGSHKSAMSIQCCTYANCFRVYSLVFNRYPFKITNPLFPDAIQAAISCNLARYAKNSIRLHSFFIQLASSMASLLKSICMGKKEDTVLRSSMPLYMSVLSLLMRCLILASDRQKLSELPRPQLNGHNNEDETEHSGDTLNESANDVFETHLEFLARDVGRILNNLSYLEVKLVDYAPHLISTYVRDTQRASCPDYVRKHMDEGVFRIFNLVDAHQKKRQEEIVGKGTQRKTSAGRASGSLFKMIHARLDQASREIFKSMHEEYSRFHRYQGKC